MKSTSIGKIFLHGLDSSSQGNKGRFFQEHFREISCPDFSGDLQARLDQLDAVCASHNGPLLLIGSSFGGLMATCYAIAHPDQVARLILLAPALNFADYTPPPQPIAIPTLLIIGEQDQVTPANLVVPLAQQTFSRLETLLVNDDHLLRATFPGLDWSGLLL